MKDRQLSLLERIKALLPKSLARQEAEAFAMLDAVFERTLADRDRAERDGWRFEAIPVREEPAGEPLTQQQRHFADMNRRITNQRQEIRRLRRDKMRLATFIHEVALGAYKPEELREAALTALERSAYPFTDFERLVEECEADRLRDGDCEA